MAPPRWILAFLFASAMTSTDGFAVIGYVPDWRWAEMDWTPAVQRTTHLIVMGLEPNADGELIPEGVERLRYLLQKGSKLDMAMVAAGENAPRIMAGIGGQGRSTHFPTVTSTPKARKRLAKQLARLIQELPYLVGADLNWEAPKETSQYRDLGKLAVEIRAASKGEEQANDGPDIVLTMSYHPLVGQVRHFSQLKSNKSGTKFVDLFDFCHSIAYSKYDEEKKHSTFEMAQGAIEEWVRVEGLPKERLALGLPFFGISRDKNGEHLSYSAILEMEPALARSPQVDETTEGRYYYNGINMIERKVHMATKLGIAGVSLWEIAQDKYAGRDGEGTLLKAVWNSAVSSGLVERGGAAVGTEGIFGALYDFTAKYMPWLNEDKVILAMAVVYSAYYCFQCLFAGQPPHRKAAEERLRRLPPRKKHAPAAAEPEEATEVDGVAAESEAAVAVSKTENEEQ